VAQLVGHLTVGIGSGHDLRVMGWSPASGSALSSESAEDSLSLSLCPYLPARACSLSLK